MEHETLPDDRERALLREITGLANHVRDMRFEAVFDKEGIKLLTGDLQAKWEEMRALRAPGGQHLHRYGGLYA